MNGKKLIKGVIYDDPDIILDAMATTISDLNYLVSTNEGINKLNESMEYFDDVPSREEFLTSVIIDCIVDPAPFQHNMIIPSTAVSEKLYNDLKKVDMGPYLQEAFVDYTVEYHRANKKSIEDDNEDYEQGYEIVQSGPNGNVYRFHSKEDLINFIEAGHKNGNFSDRDYVKMMCDIDRLSA